MFNLTGSEIIVILLLALVVLGPEKLPDAIRKFATTYAELKKMSTGFQSELKQALDEPMREIRDTANLLQNAANPKAVAAEAEADVTKRAQTDAASAAGFPTVTAPLGHDDHSIEDPRVIEDDTQTDESSSAETVSVDSVQVETAGNESVHAQAGSGQPDQSGEDSIDALQTVEQRPINHVAAANARRSASPVAQAHLPGDRSSNDRADDVQSDERDDGATGS